MNYKRAWNLLKAAIESELQLINETRPHGAHIQRQVLTRLLIWMDRIEQRLRGR